MPQPAFRAFAAEIERKIISGEIKPGDALPSEAKLAEELGVNRSTVREAIRVLEQNGFVRREVGKKKLFASLPQSGEISQRLKMAMVLNQVTFEELWEAMYALEPAAADAASRRRTEADIEALERNLADTREALADSLRLTELDIEFHQIVAKATANRAIEAARLPIGELFYPPFLAVMSRLNAKERLLYAHEQIVDAIRKADAPRAREWMEKHILDFRRGYELANLGMERPAILPAGQI
ncbi:FCD domain-containing protein [Aquamicrobium sp. LC103]|uniref:FadR/GntR family transcriptional regulator n=1 Tax=Aquamicrobium sp. LC103 TaxID=1120658 RepID=UPI0009E53492|nr:FCD domain-containing protein [Aquamicrobium sp. LC103]TKT69911.1 FadR family transcriptional regulator [Aquamicrobium sp. LC103]